MAAELPAAEIRLRTLQLTRLERFTDVVYAIVVWRLFAMIPQPGRDGWHWDDISSFAGSEWPILLLCVIGLIFTIMYWLQSHTLLGKLQRSDGRHSVLSILQIFFLFTFLYAIRSGIALGASPSMRAFESLTAAAVGFSGGFAWAHAVKNKLVHSSVSSGEAVELRYRFLAEPVTALVTLPFVFTPILWELSWFTYPLVIKIMKGRGKAAASSA